jgi:hypothetical protein
VFVLSIVVSVPVRNGDNHAGEVASMSLELLRAIKNFQIRHRSDETLKLRIGIHSGKYDCLINTHTLYLLCLVDMFITRQSVITALVSSHLPCRDETY